MISKAIKSQLTELGFRLVRDNYWVTHYQGKHHQGGYHVDIAATNGVLTAAVVCRPFVKTEKVTLMLRDFNIVWCWGEDGLVLWGTRSKAGIRPRNLEIKRKGVSLDQTVHIHWEAFKYMEEYMYEITAEQFARRFSISKRSAATWLSKWKKEGYLEFGRKVGRVHTYKISQRGWWGERVFGTEKLHGAC